MQRYIDQLISDLENAATNPPTPAYIEIPPEADEIPDIAEVALTPFKTLEELSGIKSMFFPEVYKLTADQAESVIKAIFKVFDSLKIELIDVPDNIPPEMLYEALTLNWDVYVQYLPSSGMDLELCTYDPLTCLYGEYCRCSDDDYDDLLEDDMPSDKNEQDGDDNELPF